MFDWCGEGVCEFGIPMFGAPNVPGVFPRCGEPFMGICMLPILGELKACPFCGICMLRMLGVVEPWGIPFGGRLICGLPG